MSRWGWREAREACRQRVPRECVQNEISRVVKPLLFWVNSFAHKKMFFQVVTDVWYDEPTWQKDFRSLFFLYQRIITLNPISEDVILMTTSTTMADLYSRFYEIVVRMPLVDWKLYNLNRAGLVAVLVDLYYIAPHYGFSNQFIRDERMDKSFP